MNEAFYKKQFATGKYGGDSYDVESLLPMVDLQKDYGYLEVGAGTGRFLFDFVTRTNVKPKHICATDLENNLQPFVSELGVPVEFQKINLGSIPLPYADNSFDVVICNHVLEHIFETESALRELQRVTAPGGYCIVSVPNMANWWSRFTFLLCGELPLGIETGTEAGGDGLIWLLKRRFKGFKPSGHIRGFTPRALRDLCTRCGFQFFGWWNQNFGWRNKLLKLKIGIILRKR